MARGFLRTIGRDVLFTHWPVDPDALHPLVLDGLAVDTFDGRGWVSALAIRDVRTGVRGLGAVAERSGPQLALRTYVERGDDAGVYFLGIDAGDRLGAALGRRALGLLISAARIETDRRRGVFRFRSRRPGIARRAARFDARYRPTGGAVRPQPGSIEVFLIERSRFFTAETDSRSDESDRSGRRNHHSRSVSGVGEIARSPWLIREASANVETEGLLAAVGLDAPSSTPLHHYSEGFLIDTGRPRALERDGR
jgi:uncharacterized protein YqjF (DUF2071 family)